MHATATPPFTRQLTVEALQQAVRWPHPDRRAVLTLVGQFLATRRDRDGLAYFAERALAHPDQPLFQALEGLFQARLTNSQSLIHRVAWLNDAIARLDRAVTQALDRLREVYQQLNPFKFIVYSGWALAELRPVA